MGVVKAHARKDLQSQLEIIEKSKINVSVEQKVLATGDH